MTLYTDISADLDAVFYNTDEFAREVIYTPKATGIPQTIPAIVDYGDAGRTSGSREDGAEQVLTCERDVRPGLGTAGVSRTVAQVTVRTSDVPTPCYRDAIEIDDVLWRVAQIFDEVA